MPKSHRPSEAVAAAFAWNFDLNAQLSRRGRLDDRNAAR